MTEPTSLGMRPGGTEASSGDVRDVDASDTETGDADASPADAPHVDASGTETRYVDADGADARDLDASRAVAQGAPASDTDTGDAEQGVRAFIDLGTNSVRLVIVRFMPGDTHTVLNQQKEVVRLGEDEFIDSYLQSGAMRRAALVCRKFAEMAGTYGSEEVVAVATSATREARNRKEFVKLLREDAGLDVHTISGREEARLIYLGVSSGIHMDKRSALFVDIGGGSTEIVVGDQHEYRDLDSLQLGAIRLTSMFFMPDDPEPVSAERYALLQRYVRNASLRAVQRFARHSIDMAVGSSGTIENLADIAVRRFEGRPRIRDVVLTVRQVRKVVRLLRDLPLAERRNVPGINPGRADIIVAGGAILETLMEDFGLETLAISDRGLREGLIVDHLTRRNPELLREMTVRERSVLHLGRACGFDEPHARVVAHLADGLFDSARELGLHEYGDGERELLRHAAMLHDIGGLLSYPDHHLHTHYLIRNADMLGFDQTEIATIAAIARFHRKGYPRRRRPEYAALDRAAQRIVRPLAIFLRLAESLDRSHAGLVRCAALRDMEDGRIALDVDCGDDCQLELWGAEANGKVFEKAFGRELVVCSK